MAIDEEDRERFLKYRPFWAWYRAEPAGAGCLFCQYEFAVDAKCQLPEEYILTRSVGKEYLERIFSLTFVLLVIIPGAYFINTDYTDFEVLDFFVLSGIIWIILIWVIDHYYKTKKPELVLVLTRDSLIFYPKGEFRWKNIAEMRSFYDTKGSCILLLLLNDGTLVEERLPPIDEGFLMNGIPFNPKTLEQAIEQYWNKAKPEKLSDDPIIEKV